MNSLFTKTLAAIALSATLVGASPGLAQATPAVPIEDSGSATGSGDSGSSLKPLITFPLGALYILLCDAEPNGPVCALIYEIGSGSSESDAS
ncbi:hypothetical protein NN3_28450 [Nocardia neocaledoniensis NBRC 108232]|uniref:Uncharacterized protein n=1 Tax=Nocardia neocaledoniensis TaxID=236511 RepID=A0A317NJ23_9NOCA|nr:hypothetical protein [Nocardia neocaledoniensis]PWV75115.1 hypothetical protein DFR69_105189 [Nocardia neocaledoniensis]GEM31838.1 hypothetical protein NN3_28450 [Nocardia neocaledoniensis NBRC 108232]